MGFVLACVVFDGHKPLPLAQFCLPLQLNLYNKHAREIRRHRKPVRGGGSVAERP
jgi:hypothetical protein